MAYRHGLTDEAWREFATGLREALAAPPHLTVSVRVQATTEQGCIDRGELRRDVPILLSAGTDPSVLHRDLQRR